MVVKVLLVDSDASAAGLAAHLREQGVDVKQVDQGSSALALHGSADAILLALKLPDADGFHMCQTIRLQSTIPILTVADRNDEFDHVLALKMGADDYIVKPYRYREVSARLEAVIRRIRNYSSDALPMADILRSGRSKCIGNVMIDMENHRVTVDGREIKLTSTEFDLFALLARDPGCTLTRADIMTEIWGREDAQGSRALGVHMANVRRKIGKPGLIKTVRGIGFRLAG